MGSPQGTLSDPEAMREAIHLGGWEDVCVPCSHVLKPNVCEKAYLRDDL